MTLKTTDQRGIASIVVTMSISIILALIVLGFAGIMRRESRQAADQQLSSQAFYAAESALNKKVAEIREADSITPINSCSAASDEIFSESTDIRSTCVLVNPSPETLEYDEVKTDRSTIVILRPEAGNFSHFVISWENTSGVNACTNTTNESILPTSLAATEDVGMLRIDLTPIKDATDLSRDNLINNTFSALLYPHGTGGLFAQSVNSVAPDQPLIFGTCGAGDIVTSSLAMYTAKARIQLNPESAGPYLLRLRGVYESSKVRISAISNTGTELKFADSQVVVDSTARVSDVVRRIQARVSLTQVPADFPDFALRTTDSLCKMLRVPVPSATPTDGC